MDPKQEQAVQSQVREILLQIAQELEASAASARSAAASACGIISAGLSTPEPLSSR